MLQTRALLVVMLGLTLPTPRDPAHAAQGTGRTAPRITLRDAWVRESTALRTVSSGYLTIENHTGRDVTLVKLTVDRAGRAEFHEIVHEHGKASMRAVTAVPI